MRRAVADRVDVGQTGLAQTVDEHPVAARGARCDQRLDRGNDADADDDEVGGDDFAVRQPNTDDALGALDRFDRDAEPPVDAMLAVPAFVATRQCGARYAHETTTDRPKTTRRQTGPQGTQGG